MSFFLVFRIIKVATVLQNYFFFLRLSEILRCGYDSVCDVYNGASVCLGTWLEFSLLSHFFFVSACLIYII